MQTTTLHVKQRNESGKGVARKLRRSGRVPGVIYGGGDDPVLVSMEAQGALRLFEAISVENTILDLRLDDKDGERALVREIQLHPHRPQLLHVDFIRVKRGVPIEVQVPIHLTGVPDGVRNEGGLLDHVLHDLQVKCLPSKIPEVIEVDVTALMIGDVLRAGDIEVPEEVEVLVDPAMTVCGVAAPKIVDEDEEGLAVEEAEEEAEGVEAEATFGEEEAE